MNNKKSDDIKSTDIIGTAFVTVVAIFLTFIGFFYVPNELQRPEKLGISIGLSLLEAILGLSFSIFFEIRNKHNDLLHNLPILRETMDANDLCQKLTDIAKKWKGTQNPNTNSLMLTFRQKLLSSFLSALDDLSRSVKFPGEETWHLTNAVNAISKEMRAIGMFSMEWWDEPQGRTYKAKNLEVLKRGIEVSRIFVFREGISDDDRRKIEGLIKDFSSAGKITAHILDLSAKPRSPDLCPMLICDDNLVIISEIDALYNPVQHIAYFDDDYVKDYKHRFDSLCADRCEPITVKSKFSRKR